MLISRIKSIFGTHKTIKGASLVVILAALELFGVNIPKEQFFELVAQAILVVGLGHKVWKEFIA